MTNIDVIRAWKDEEYRSGLSERERTLLPANPVGLIELSDDDLTAAGGEEIQSHPWTITIPISIIITNVFSCGIACQVSVAQGTCAILSQGCC